MKNKTEIKESFALDWQKEVVKRVQWTSVTLIATWGLCKISHVKKRGYFR